MSSGINNPTGYPVFGGTNKSATGGYTGVALVNNLPMNITGYDANGNAISGAYNIAGTGENGSGPTIAASYFSNNDIANAAVQTSTNLTQNQQIAAGTLDPSTLTSSVAQAQQANNASLVSQLASQINVANGSNTISVPAPVQAPGTTSTTGSTIASANSVVPQSAVSPTTTDPDAALLASLLSSSGSGGSNTSGQDTSLPPPSAADVAALQPTTAPTSSSGVSPVVLILIVVGLGAGGYFWWKHRKKGESA